MLITGGDPKLAHALITGKEAGPREFARNK